MHLWVVGNVMCVPACTRSYREENTSLPLCSTGCTAGVPNRPHSPRLATQTHTYSWRHKEVHRCVACNGSSVHNKCVFPPSAPLAAFWVRGYAFWVEFVAMPFEFDSVNPRFFVAPSVYDVDLEQLACPNTTDHDPPFDNRHPHSEASAVIGHTSSTPHRGDQSRWPTACLLCYS